MAVEPELYRIEAAATVLISTAEAAPEAPMANAASTAVLSLKFMISPVKYGRILEHDVQGIAHPGL